MMNKNNAILTVLLAFVAFLALKWISFYGYFSPGRVSVKLNSSYDYIVVGGGSSGSVVAARLSENPNITVLLLEAGGEETDSPTYQIPGFMFSHLFTDIDWSYQIVKQDNAQANRKAGNEEYWGAGRVLGGGSIINYLNYVRGSKHDYNTWEQNGCTGWGYKDVLPYFLKSEDIQVDSLKDSKFHGTGGFLGVSEVEDPPLSDDFKSAGREMGYEIIDYNGEREIGYSSNYWNMKNGARSSPSIDLLRSSMARENLHVSIRSVVTKIIIKDKLAVGVEFIKNGRKIKIAANAEVILSAGALGSPKILMLSGIGPKRSLENLNIPLVIDLPVGFNLQYHYIIPFWVSTNSSDLEAKAPSVFDFLQFLLFNTGPLASNICDGVAFLRADDQRDGPADFQLQVLKGKLPAAMTGLKELEYIDKLPGISAVFFHLHPKSIGFMKLKSQDPFDQAIYDPKYFSNSDDMKEVIAGIRTLQKKIINTRSMQKYNLSLELSNIPLCKHEQFDSDNYWDCFVRNTVLGCHHTSTCKMGAVNDKSTVVGPDLTVKGIKGLRVMDASIMPSVVSGNTNAPSIMIGEKGADLVLKDLNKK